MARQDPIQLDTPAVTANVTTSSGVTAFAQTGSSIVITNMGTNPAFCTVGTATTTASATTNICILPNTQASFKIKNSQTHIAHISPGGNTTLNVAVGTGV